MAVDTLVATVGSMGGATVFGSGGIVACPREIHRSTADPWGAELPPCGL
ncbi:MAG TPA: hypothetical protein VMT57_01655 [Candidatus Thermoplasmatota archaeon]|nr:hypothetical protein [Candidatus Thermoplasmatota archaeon]